MCFKESFFRYSKNMKLVENLSKQEQDIMFLETVASSSELEGMREAARTFWKQAEDIRTSQQRGIHRTTPQTHPKK
jgi:hypothetical protein